MDENKNQSSGAPSSDTTSALFVSARKKQLEQQEEERRAKEKEEQRLAAEAEVRRLEREVEERRRRAEEETRRIAEEAQAKKAMAAENPEAVLGTPAPPPIWPAKKEPQAAPVVQKPVTTGGGGGSMVAGLLQDKKKLAIIAGAVVVVLAVVLIIALSSGKGGGNSDNSGVPDLNVDLDSYYSDYGVSFSHPEGWYVINMSENPLSLKLLSEYTVGGYTDTIEFCNINEEFFGNYNGDAVETAQTLLDDYIWYSTGSGTYDGYSPDVYEMYDNMVAGETEVEVTMENGTELSMYFCFTPIDNVQYLFIYSVYEAGDSDDRLQLCRDIAATFTTSDYDDYENEASGMTYASGATVANGDGTSTYSDSSSNVKVTYPSEMSVCNIDNGGVVVFEEGTGYVVGRNLTSTYSAYSGSEVEFTRDYIVDQVYSDFLSIYGEAEGCDEPYIYMDENAQANRIGTADMTIHLHDRSIIARAIIYHTVEDGNNTNVVMVKTFYAEVGNDTALDYLYNSVVNIVNVN